jgi:hypothetical protein
MEPTPIFWQIFTAAIFFIVWAGSILNIKPFVAIWKVMKWFLIMVIGVLFIDYAKNEVKDWWSK